MHLASKRNSEGQMKDTSSRGEDAMSLALIFS